MEYTTVVALGIFCLLMVHAEEPVPSSQVSNRSRYHQQVEFISNYLLQGSNASRSTVNITSSNNNNDAASINKMQQQSLFVDKIDQKDNKTTPNEIQVIPVPAAVSSAIDTLPVHPRIPRRSSTRRRSRNEHRHSTRVFQGQPVRFLLPPFQNEMYEALLSTTITPDSTNSIFIPPVNSVSFTTPTPTEAANYDHELSDNKLGQKESKHSSSGPHHRRVFIPPPLRYLLPPFFYENYINAQSSTSPSPVTQGRLTEPFTLLTEEYYYPTNSSVLSQNNSVESSSLAPIIVIETVSQQDYEQIDWNYPIEKEEYTTSASINYAYNEREPKRSSTTPYVNKLVSSTEPPHKYSELLTNPLQHEYYDEEDIKSYRSGLSSVYPSAKSKFSTTPVPQTNESIGVEYGVYKTTPIGNYPSRSTTIPSTVFPSTAYAILRGPNIEQALFDTGDFQSFNTTHNESGDPTLAMMNRPLLAQEVAQAGMKITANIKKEQINRDNMRRGKSKFNHLNQFNFQAAINSRGTSKSSQLAVAESSYYNSGRASKQIVQEADIRAIPGRPGHDYPTFTKPPTRSNFSCRSVGYHRGYVADPSTGCQVFYICVGDGPGEPMLCPNGTIFSQDFLVCDWWYNVDCHRQT